LNAIDPISSVDNCIDTLRVYRLPPIMERDTGQTHTAMIAGRQN